MRLMRQLSDCSKITNRPMCRFRQSLRRPLFAAKVTILCVSDKEASVLSEFGDPNHPHIWQRQSFWLAVIAAVLVILGGLSFWLDRWPGLSPAPASATPTRVVIQPATVTSTSTPTAELPTSTPSPLPTYPPPTASVTPTVTMPDPATSTPLPSPTPLPAASPTPTLIPQGQNYIVQPGDNLCWIAGAAYRDCTKYWLIFAANHGPPAYLQNPNLIHAGVPLYIPYDKDSR